MRAPSVLAGVLLLICPALSFATQPHRPAVPQEVFAPFWTVQSGWHTELMVRNNTGTQITVTPVLRNRTGTETPLEPVALDANDSRMISVADVLGRIAPGLLSEPDAFGSVVFRYTSRTVGNIYASVLLGRTGSPIEFHFDAAPSVPDLKSAGYQSIWWRPSDNQKETLVLANLFDQPLRGTIRIFDAKGHSTAYPFTLAARETQQISVTELPSKYEIAGEFGGVAIEPQNHPGYLQAMHFTIDEAAGLGALLKVLPRFELPERHFTIRAPMLALAHPDPALALPPQTVLAPRIFLFNGNVNPVVASVLVDWHSSSQWGRTPLPQVTVAPGATYTLTLGESEQQRLGIPPSATWASVQISYASADSDLVAMAASLSADGKHLVQTPFSDGLSFKWKGGEWMVDADHDALITAGNAGTKPARLDFKLRYGGGSQLYELPIRVLQPGEAITVDVAKIITTQQRGRNGKVIPPSIMSGTYEFSDLDDIGMGYLYEGKQQIDKTYGHATYGCAACCYYDAAWITDFAGKVGDSGPIPALADESCPAGDYEGVDVTSYTTNWASGDPSIATVAPDLAHAVAAGQTSSSATSNLRTLHVHNDLYTCPGAIFNPPGGIRVARAIPVNFRQVGPGQSSGGILTFEYAWDSSTGHVADLSNCIVGEYVTYPTFGHDSGLFFWPSPPYSATPTTPDPTIGNFPGTDHGFGDQHSHNNFQTPYSANVFDAAQTYRWSCSDYYNGQWQTITNNTIERSVQKHISLPSWYYLVTKSGYSASVDPLP